VTAPDRSATTTLVVVATGSTLADDEIPGLAAGGHDYYSESGALALRDDDSSR